MSRQESTWGASMSRLDEAKTYCLDIDDYGEVSWYKEHQLTEITDE
jgi:hypothetical protein